MCQNSKNQKQERHFSKYRLICILTSYSSSFGATKYRQFFIDCCGGAQDNCGSKGLNHDRETFCGGKICPKVDKNKNNGSVISFMYCCHNENVDLLVLAIDECQLTSLGRAICTFVEGN